MSTHKYESLLAVDIRGVRSHNGTVSISFPKESMRAVGVLDEDGELVGSPKARVVVRDDETALIEFRTDG